MKLASIHIYPVKSLAGQPLDEARVEPWGLQHDRRWAVLEPDGTRLSAREEHQLLGIGAQPSAGGIVLTARDGQKLAVATPVDGGLVPTSISRLESVRVAGEEANAWLSRQIGRPVRLAWLDDPRRRSIAENHGGEAGDALTLADAGPLLLTTTASLAQLNEWMADDAVRAQRETPPPMVMPRFRPNIVVDEVAVPFDEDSWQSIRIGTTDFRFAELCDRCVMTTLDPHTLAGGKEPLRTLAAHRQWDHKTWFGVRIVPLAPGTISVGDPVEVLVRVPASGRLPRPADP